MAIVIATDGQQFPYPDDIAGDDERLRDALSSILPEIRNAELKRTKVNGEMQVRIIKRAGTKGGTLLSELFDTPDSDPIALGLHDELRLVELRGDLNSHTILTYQKRIIEAIKDADIDLRGASRSRNKLKSCSPQPSPIVPEGF
jgi:hypothetical protein